MKLVKAIIQPFRLDHVMKALSGVKDLPGVTVSEVLGWGQSKGAQSTATATEGGHVFAKKVKLEIVVAEARVDETVAAIATAAHTGRVGDGKVFVMPVDRTLGIRTGQVTQ